MSAAILQLERRAAPPEESPSALAARALRGERDAWSRLIELHNRKVLVALLAKGATMAQAQEVAHEAWVRLIEQQRRGALTQLTLPSLAIAQAGFLWLDERRRGSGRAGPASSELELSDLRHEGPSPEARMLGKQELGRTLAALERCSAAERRVFDALYGDQCASSHGEAAARLGLSVQRVRQVLFEVRRKLRATLEKEEP